MGASFSARVVRWEGRGTWGTRTWIRVLLSPLMGCAVLGKLSALPKPQLPLLMGCRPQSPT